MADQARTTRPPGSHPLSRRDPSAEPLGLVERGKAVWEWWKRTRVGRAFTRYSQANGALLSGGIAYLAIFSLTAALTIGYTVIMAVLGSRAELWNVMTDFIDAMLPGLLQKTPGGPGLVEPESLVFSTAITPASIVAFVVLLVSATSCIGAVRSSVRVMFGLPPRDGRALHAKMRDLGVFIVVGLAVLVSAVLGIAVNTTTSWVLSFIGIEGWGRGVIPILAFAASFLIDMGVFSLIVILLAGVHPPRKDLLLGAVSAAAAFGIMRFLGVSVVARGAQSNAVLASFAVIVTLLIWINLSARVVLTAAALTADLPFAILEKGSDVDAARDAIEQARNRSVTDPMVSTLFSEAEEREQTGAGGSSLS